jgi:uncharacterized BrkB/YihY/UPF0761 family membrane protein
MCTQRWGGSPVQPRLLARATRLTRRVAAACHEDRVDGLAAELAFFGVLSTFPGLLVVAALLGSLERLVGHDLASRSEALVLRAMDQVLTSSAAGLRCPLAFAALVAWAATVYHVAPGRRLRWREALPGAVAAAVLWLVASGGFSLYLRVAADANRVLGTLGGGLIGVLWPYLLALILLVGGELNGVLHRGREPGRQVAPPG